MHTLKYFLIACFTLCALRTQAQGFKMATTEPLHSNQQELSVKGRQGFLIKQKLRFGEYYTTSVKRSAIRKWGTTSGFPGFIWTDRMTGKQTIHFRLCNGTDTSDVFTTTNVASADLNIGAMPGTQHIPAPVLSVFKSTATYENNFSVAIYTKQGEEPWELYLDNQDAQVKRKEAAGYVRRGDDYYMLYPVWQVEKKNGKLVDMLFGSQGYEIRNKDGNAVAAVSLVDNGRVYMGEGDAQEQFLMANVSAALLLQSNIAE